MCHVCLFYEYLLFVGKCAVGKRKMKPQAVKGKKKVGNEKGDCKGS